MGADVISERTKSLLHAADLKIFPTFLAPEEFAIVYNFQSQNILLTIC